MLERQHTIKVFCAAIERLSKPTPLSDQLPIGWLKEYLSPGYYDRQNFVDDARTAYQRLNNGRMIVWLNEAAGEDDRIIRAAIIAMDERDHPQTEAKFARRVLPWDGLERLLFE